MKINESRNLIVLLSYALALTFAIAAVATAFAKPSEAQLNETEESLMPTPQPMGRQHLAMREKQQKAMVEMKAQDAKLSSQIAQIKSAPESKKMDLMIAALSTMVEQRSAMHEHMAEIMNSRMEEMPMNNGAMTPFRITKDASNQLTSAEPDEE